jgi:hypothetical protein
VWERHILGLFGRSRFCGRGKMRIMISEGLTTLKLIREREGKEEDLRRYTQHKRSEWMRIVTHC